MFKRILGIFTILTLAFTTGAFASSKTIKIKDVLEREVEVPVNAERILVGFYFEDVFAVGGPDVYDRVVAISREAWEGWRNFQWQAYVAAVPKINEIADVGEVDGGSFSLEKAVATKPEVAILAAWQFNALGDVVEQMEAAGIPVVVLDYNAQTVEKHVNSTLALGAVLGQTERAKELADNYKSSVEEVIKRVATTTERPNVHFELGRKGADEVGFSWGDVMWGKLVEVAGGTNIAKNEIAKWAPLNPEFVLAKNPEFIFLAGSGWVGKDKAIVMGPGVEVSKTHARMLPYKARPGWSEISAVKSGEISAVYHGGTRTLYDFAMLQFIAKTIHPKAFEDIDPMENLKQHFDKYMPIPLNGAYMTKLP